MNLRELEYLIALEETHNFHQAAAKCFVSQPTLSGQLKKLEQELGVLLVDRQQRKMVMTDAGMAITQQAREVLKQVKLLKEMAKSFTDPRQAKIHLGLIPTIAPYLLPTIMPSIKQSYAQLRLWLYELQTAVLLEKLADAELELLILALPIDSHAFEQVDLFDEDFYLAVSSQHELAKKRQIALSELKDKELLLLEEGHCLRDHALDVCFLAGAREQDSFHATSLETLRHMIAENLGMSLFPAMAITSWKRPHQEIVYIPFQQPVPQRKIGMLYRKGSYREELYLQLAELIKQTVGLKQAVITAP